MTHAAGSCPSAGRQGRTLFAPMPRVQRRILCAEPESGPSHLRTARSASCARRVGCLCAQIPSAASRTCTLRRLQAVAGMRRVLTRTLASLPFSSAPSRPEFCAVDPPPAGERAAPACSAPPKTAVWQGWSWSGGPEFVSLTAGPTLFPPSWGEFGFPLEHRRARRGAALRESEFGSSSAVRLP